MLKSWIAGKLLMLAGEAMMRDPGAASFMNRCSSARVNMVDATAHNRRATDAYITSSIAD